MSSCLKSVQPNCLKSEESPFCSNKKELNITKIALAVIALISLAALGTGIVLAGFHLYLLAGAATVLVATALSCYIQYRQNKISEIEEPPSDDTAPQNPDTFPLSNQPSDGESSSDAESHSSQPPVEEPFDSSSNTNLDHSSSSIDESSNKDYRKVSISKEEILVPDNGDCLFDSFALLSQVNASSAMSGISERKLTVQWMRDNYKTDLKLQNHLQNSIVEHYLAKIQKLDEEIVNLNSLNLPVDEKCLEVERLQEILAQCLKNGFSTVEPLLEDYFSEMETPGTFGGMAELYALSCRREVCIFIHNKDPRTDRVDLEPHTLINPNFTGKDPRHVTYEGKHYNPWVRKMPT